VPFSNLPSGGGGDVNWFAVVMIFILSLWGGLVNYLLRLKSGIVKIFNFFELFCELIISSFAGLLVGLIAIACNVDPLITLSLAGLAGNAGVRTVYFLDKIYKKRLASLSRQINQ
jgi:hypothetical protein